MALDLMLAIGLHILALLLAVLPLDHLWDQLPPSHSACRAPVLAEERRLLADHRSVTARCCCNAEVQATSWWRWSTGRTNRCETRNASIQSWCCRWQIRSTIEAASAGT